MSKKSSYFIEPHDMRCRVFTHIDGESLTHESFKEECDINGIVNRYARTGELPDSGRTGAYADCSGLQGDLTQRISESRSVVSKVETAKKAKREKQQFDLEDAIRQRVEEEIAARQGGNAPAPGEAPVSGSPAAAGAGGGASGVAAA